MTMRHRRKGMHLALIVAAAALIAAACAPRMERGAARTEVFSDLPAAPRLAPGEHRAVVEVDLQEQGAPVPAELYGIFMEEISHAFDGGIYAELIQNRDFEEGRVPAGMKLVEKEDGSMKMELESLPEGVPEDKWDMPWPWFMNCGWDPNRDLLGWSVEERGGAKGALALTEANPLNDASVQSGELQVDASDGGAVALINSGYWGINVEEGVTYDLVFHLRPEDFEGSVAPALESEDGTVLAKGVVRGGGRVRTAGAWREYRATLQATASDSKARFVLEFQGEGTVQVDWVSLFPPTYKNRPNGLRPDLAQLLEDYKPAFVRYPGGCYAEGLSWENAPDWREMVVPPVERPGRWGYWRYRSTDGFGYHEFLQFCEDIGADALYVAWGGMTVHPENNVPLDEIDPVIQQTLDAIEYAIGPTDSKWGALRAKNGHPEPFPLKYVQIGNEHPPAVYGDYYVKFREAIREKYRNRITVVMSMFFSGLNQAAIERAGDRNIDIVDEHAYKGSGWARTNWNYFDRYERTPWKVYVGEYASHHANGDWSAAMDDSLFLMMMERNGDHVKMASYAPLFVNVKDRDWGVNLIEFDGARSFAHSSYYVQKAFNENRPDANLHTRFETFPKADPDASLMSGRIGLGAWDTQAEFKELRVLDGDGNVVYESDFESLEDWTPDRGDWEVADGVLKQNALGDSPANILLKDFELETGTIEIKARRVGGREGFLLLFNAEGPNRYLFCNYGAAGNRFSAIQSRGTPAGTSWRGGRNTEGAVEDQRWYDVKLEVEKDRAVMYLDGERVSSARLERLPSFFSQAGYDKSRQEAVVKATNYYGEPIEVEIALDGAEWVGETGKHVVMSSASPDDQNTLDAPRKIVPREQRLTGCAERFTVVLPAYSVNILRIPAKIAVEEEIPMEARPLDLSKVRLDGGPLKYAQDQDSEYLLELEPDRMMVYYRERAGLPPKNGAEPYGGWDGGGRNLTGHVAGHYLSAVALMYAATGDERFKERADYLVAEMKEVQDAHGDGYLSAIEGGRECWEAVARGDIRSGGFDLNGQWAPWYTLHKTYAGLRDAYRFTGNKTALDVEVKFAEWAEGVVGGLSHAQRQQMLDTEFGGMEEVFADLYHDTGNERWLNLSYLFEHELVVDPLKRHEDNLAGKHGNTQIPKLIGSADRYAYADDAGDLMAASFFWDRVVKHHTFATGGHGKNEYFHEPDDLARIVDGRTAETCNVYNMLKLTRRLFEFRPSPHYADFQERALYNHILASINPEDGRMCYMVPVGRGVRHEYNSKFDSFTCCVGTAMESHALHADGVYYESPNGEKFWVNVYMPSTAKWEAAGATIRQETDFPIGETAKLTLGLQKPREFTLVLRRPYWARDGFRVSVNGEVVDLKTALDETIRYGQNRRRNEETSDEDAIELTGPSDYVEIDREWRDGDVIEVVLPKKLHVEYAQGDRRIGAIMWGPLVLAADLGPEPPRGRGRRGGEEGEEEERYTPPVIPAMIAENESLDEWVVPVEGRPGVFRTQGAAKIPAGGGTAADVTLEPFYKVHNCTYAIYWDFFTDEAWDLQMAEYEKEQERLQKLEAATVAFAQPGEMQPERDFSYEGAEDARVRRTEGRHGRSARSWFSFEMPVEPGRPMELVVTYYSADVWRGASEFAIQIDGETIAEESIRREEPPRFYDKEYAIPAALVDGKEKVVVRFQAPEESWITTVYGLRMIRADAAR